MKVVLKLNVGGLPGAEAAGQLEPRERVASAKKKEGELISVSPEPVKSAKASPQSSAKKRKKVTRPPDVYATPSDTDYAAEADARSLRTQTLPPPESQETPEPAIQAPSVARIDFTVPWKVLVDRITRPSEPCDFIARGRPPYEPKVDKVYCIYTPHTFEELRPIFYSPHLNVSELFAALSGHKMPSSKDLDEDYEWWALKIKEQYTAFAGDLARNEILVARIFAQGGGKQWSRLEFGREVWNYGQNYGSAYWLGMQKVDTKRVRRVLAREDTDDEVESDDVDDGADADAQGDGAWKPQRRRRGRC